jgi:hypothetical protein
MIMIRVIIMVGQYIKDTIQTQDVIEVKLNILKFIKSFLNQIVEK